MRKFAAGIGQLLIKRSLIVKGEVLETLYEATGQEVAFVEEPWRDALLVRRPEKNTVFEKNEGQSVLIQFQWVTSIFGGVLKKSNGGLWFLLFFSADSAFGNIAKFRKNPLKIF